MVRDAGMRRWQKYKEDPWKRDEQNDWCRGGLPVPSDQLADGVIWGNMVIQDGVDWLG